MIHRLSSHFYLYDARLQSTGDEGGALQSVGVDRSPSSLWKEVLSSRNVVLCLRSVTAFSGAQLVRPSSLS
jgi:hypothetical protein